MPGLLRSFLDLLDADALEGLVTDDQVLDRTAVLVAVRNAADAELTRTVRKAENMQAPERDGTRSMRSWLRGHVRLSAREAARIVRNGRALEQFPAVAKAFAEGAVTAEQVAVIAPAAAVDVLAEAVGQGIDVSAVDELLAEVATTQEHAVLGTVVQHFLARLDPDGSEPDPTERRAVSISRHADGSVSGRFELDAVGGEKFCSVLESMVQADRPAGDLRTRSRQLGDALVQWADNTLAAGQLPILRTVKPHVIVTIPLADLVDLAALPGAGSTGFGAEISAARARMLACDGNVTRIVIGPEGQPLEAGRTKRVFPPHLRRAVDVRDHHCVFAGCSAPSHWCDVHHLVHWAHGGETDVDNAALLCERHHTKVHHGFRVERQPDGRWRTWRPDGTEILLGSALLA
ncbi:HNH endonuclease [Blastococcus tunisiensis]|uniref:HNH endonuclease n=1 Tax=Blastococcus tunisiensis TaxID=1798228 RepID=A0A1I1WE13_9ACTN|nr:HNH endonuclease signature motif containing protein [Blastococcus sp. DSM 46838]SFD93394.1 HNH endonuclease [Blastococcus sp. DSM 46838]